ncbi:triacylglycerol lipase 2-like isoform X3 [Asparagus officinalis]|uniref:triacylglycerol lipase 2-like isoform X3 n=1 Tax=Asparagus officinalis TaxID=4686 RepID=UPI00098E4CB6|nr:triacylglycerol lipase 2-like isoform X3 [Asparagus officinalis]
MANYLTFMLAWLLFFALTFFVAIWSSTPTLAQTQSTSAGICKSRVEIYGYKCEEHTVTTKDGYILSLQRIPNGHHSVTMKGKKKKKIPVLLQHGIFMDGITFLLNSPENSLGYILADGGYDVWIANSRGTKFSRRHTVLSVNQSEYWDWSWDELVAYDLPAFYYYVYEHSGQQKIHYVGHSLGTLLALASFSEMPLIGMTRSAALICPIAYLNGVRSPIARIAADSFLADAYYWLGLNEFNPTSELVKRFLKIICKQSGSDCYDLVTDFTVLRTGTIRKFDYGDASTNIKHYGNPHPPVYDMKAIPKDLPLFLSYGGRDWLSDVEDVKRLLADLKPHRKMKARVNYQACYAHGDFVMGINARQLVYNPLLSFLKLHI